MSKYFIFSFDDGTVHDVKFLKLLKKYGFCGVFNLNSGLNDYVWESNGIPIVRPDLSKNKNLYDGQEIASHTLTHPHLTECDENEVIRQVQGDINNLENIYQRKIKSFAFPFDDWDERTIEVIKNHTSVENIRLSEIDENFDLPEDLYHINITALDLDRAEFLFDKFVQDERENLLFVFAGHSYDFYLNNSFEQLELFLKKIKKSKVKVITFSQFVDIYYQIKYSK